MGLTPKDHSTAGKTRLGGITRAGDELLPKHIGGWSDLGDTAGTAHQGQERFRASYKVTRARPKLAAVALANKIARIAWKLMVSGEHYRRPIEQAIPAMAA